MSSARAYLLFAGAVVVGAVVGFGVNWRACLAVGGAFMLALVVDTLVRLSGLESRLRDLEGVKAAAERSGRVLRGWPKRRGGAQ